MLALKINTCAFTELLMMNAGKGKDIPAEKYGTTYQLCTRCSGFPPEELSVIRNQEKAKNTISDHPVRWIRSDVRDQRE